MGRKNIHIPYSPMNLRKLLLSTKSTPFGFRYHERKVPKMDKSEKRERGEILSMTQTKERDWNLSLGLEYKS